MDRMSACYDRPMQHGEGRKSLVHGGDLSCAGSRYCVVLNGPVRQRCRTRCRMRTRLRCLATSAVHGLEKAVWSCLLQNRLSWDGCVCKCRRPAAIAGAWQLAAGSWKGQLGGRGLTRIESGRVRGMRSWGDPVQCNQVDAMQASFGRVGCARALEPVLVLSALSTGRTSVVTIYAMTGGGQSQRLVRAETRAGTADWIWGGESTSAGEGECRVTSDSELLAVGPRVRCGFFVTVQGVCD